MQLNYHFLILFFQLGYQIKNGCTYNYYVFVFGLH